jgi:2'-hydroxyisoflavone reductase
VRVLVAGGTSFIGRHLVELLLDEGHQVTLFHRGRTNRDLFPDAARIFGDRDDPPAAVAGQAWDWVFDVSGYTPEQVERLAAAVAPRTGRYVFVSTAAVYRRRLQAADVAEDDPLWSGTAEELAAGGTMGYGARKAAAERALGRVAAAAGMAAVVVRPVLVYGPWDPTDRCTWWLHRVQQGGVVVPPPPAAISHCLYVKDLARILVAAAKAGHAAGRAYNAAAPHYRSLAEWIATAAAVLGRPVRVREAPLPGLPAIQDGGVRTVSTRRLQEDLGFVATPFPATLAEVYDHLARTGRTVTEAVAPELLAQLLA